MSYLWSNNGVLRIINNNNFIYTDDTNMASIWWKIIALYILLAPVTHSTGLEIDDYSKLSNENIMLLFKKLFKVKPCSHSQIFYQS